MLKYCVETMFDNKGEGLLQACISIVMKQFTLLFSLSFCKNKMNL